MLRQLKLAARDPLFQTLARIGHEGRDFQQRARARPIAAIGGDAWSRRLDRPTGCD